MISLTRTTGERCCLDPAHVVRVESDPDTVVTMTDGARYVVVETIAQVVERVRNFRAAVLVSAWRWVHVPEGEAGTVVTRSPDRAPADPAFPGAARVGIRQQRSRPGEIACRRGCPGRPTS